MRRLPAPFLLACLPLLGTLLGSCNRTADTFKPHISITESGSISKDKSFVVDGYAMDDTGVTRITVDGKSIPIMPGSNKLARFQFKTLIQGEKGEYTITAEDAAGNKSTMKLPVSVDPILPTIRVTRFEKNGNAIRVAGVASDNNRVEQVMVDGNRLNITPGQKIDFYAETTGIWADIEVIDAAGNKAKLRAR